MTTFIAIVLLILLLPVTVLLHVAFQRRGLRRSLEQRFPQSTILPVRFTTREIMLAGQPPARSAAWGFLVANSEQCRVVGRFPASGAVQEFEIDAGTRIASIPKSARGVGVPDLVRVASEAQVLFLFSDKGLGTNRVAFDNIVDTLGRRYPTETVALPTSRIADAAMYPLAAVLFAAVGAVIYFSLRAVPDFGIDAVHVGDQATLMASSTRELVVLGPDESIAKVFQWEDLGVRKGAADIEVLGGRRLLVGDFEEGVIKDCDLDQSVCRPLSAFAESGLRFRRTFKFVLAPDRQTILAVDTARHRLLQINRATGDYQISNQPLCFPNRIDIGPRGQVLVADTNNHRLLEWSSWKTWLDVKPIAHYIVSDPPKVESCGESAVGDAFLERPVTLSSPATAMEQLRGGRIWPTDFTWMPGGDLWVLLGNSDLRYGDIAIFDAHWQFKDKVGLDASLDLVQIAAYGDEALLIDAGEDRIPVANAKGEIVRSLSKKHLGERTRHLREEYLNYRLYSTIALGSVLLLLTITLVVGVLSMRRRLRQIAAI